MPFSPIQDGKHHIQYSDIPGETIRAAGLKAGEIAINTADAKMYMRAAGGNLLTFDGQWSPDINGIATVNMQGLEKHWDSRNLGTLSVSEQSFTVTPPSGLTNIVGWHGMRRDGRLVATGDDGVCHILDPDTNTWETSVAAGTLPQTFYSYGKVYTNRGRLLPFRCDSIGSRFQPYGEMIDVETLEVTKSNLDHENYAYKLSASATPLENGLLLTGNWESGLPVKPATYLREGFANPFPGGTGANTISVPGKTYTASPYSKGFPVANGFLVAWMTGYENWWQTRFEIVDLDTLDTRPGSVLEVSQAQITAGEVVGSNPRFFLLKDGRYACLGRTKVTATEWVIDDLADLANGWTKTGVVPGITADQQDTNGGVRMANGDWLFSMAQTGSKHSLMTLNPETLAWTSHTTASSFRHDAMRLLPDGRILSLSGNHPLEYRIITTHSAYSATEWDRFSPVNQAIQY